MGQMGVPAEFLATAGSYCDGVKWLIDCFYQSINLSFLQNDHLVQLNLVVLYCLGQAISLVAKSISILS